VSSAAASLLLSQSAMAAPDGVTQVPPPVPRASARPQAQTLEKRNRALATARLQQQIAPTLENERRLAQEYASAGVLDAAYDHFSAALRLDPHDVPSLDGIARIWRDWGFPESALPHAYRAIYWAPNSAPAQNTLGTVLLKLRLIDAARERFELARALDPSATYPLNNLCYIELLRGNRELSATLCREAAAAAPESATARNNLALALAAGGDFDGAFAAFATGSPAALAAYNEGVVLVAAGQVDKARNAFARARVADPAFFPALSRLKQLSAARPGNNRPPHATADAAKANQQRGGDATIASGNGN